MIAEKQNQPIFLTFLCHVELLHMHSIQEGSKIMMEINKNFVYANL